MRLQLADMATPAILRPATRIIAPRETNDSLRQLQLLLRIAAVLWGFLAFWSARYLVSPDGISYLSAPSSDCTTPVGLEVHQ